MASLQELFNMRNNSGFRNRVAAAGWRYAKDILTEDPVTADHARAMWARALLKDQGEGTCVYEIFKGCMVILEDTDTSSTDEDVTAAVAQVVTKLAEAGAP